MLKVLKYILGEKNKECSQTTAFERLQIRTKINRHSNPILLSLEECIKEMLEEKYKEDFMLNKIDSMQKSPDYTMDAEIEYKDNLERKEAKGFFSRIFNSNRNSAETAKNRLDILIKGNKNDNILIRIKEDIEKMVYEKIQLKPENVIVEKDYDCNNSEIIKMIITLPD